MLKYCKYCLQHKPEGEFRHNRARCIVCERGFDRLRRGTFVTNQYQGFKVPTIHSYSIAITSEDTKKYRVGVNSGGKPVTERIIKCKECGTVYYSTYGKSLFCSTYCCDKHHRRIATKKHKALIRSVRVESVNPIVVFQKYDWHCARCKQHTPHSLMGKHKSNSPELDHIIPLSKGGEHSYKNTQLLCRTCNANKSNSL